MPYRSTKIVATLGPASNTPQILEEMIRAGVNVVRLNFSHGTAQDHIDRAHMVREAAKRAGREVAIMADLQGPKIRVGKFAEGKVMLEPGQPFVLDASAATESARAVAVKNARTKANSYAKLLGVKLGKISYLVENGSPSISAPTYDMPMLAKAEASPTVIDLGQQDVIVTVTVRWAL
jgi:pyruvate kinase